MVNQPVMSDEQKERYKAAFKRATAKWAGLSMKILSDDELAVHTAYVKQMAQSGEIPF